MPSVVSLVSDGSGEWTDTRHAFCVKPSFADQGTINQQSWQTIFWIRFPDDWKRDLQRVLFVGHLCFWADNFTGRRPWSVQGFGGIASTPTGTCGCSYEMTPQSTFPGVGTKRAWAVDFQFFTSLRNDGQQTQIQFFGDSTGNMTFKNWPDSQSLLWLIPVA